MVRSHKMVLVLGLVIEYVGQAVSPVRKQLVSGRVGAHGDVDVSDVEAASPVRKQNDHIRSNKATEDIGADIEGLRLKALKQVARKEGITDDQIDDAEDQEDPVQALKEVIVKNRSTKIQQVAFPNTQDALKGAEYERAKTSLENIAGSFKFGDMSLLQTGNSSSPITKPCNQGDDCSKPAKPVTGEVVAGLMATVLAGGATPEVIETITTIVSHLKTTGLAKIKEDHNDAQNKINADLENLKSATEDAVDKYHDAVDHDTAWLACVAEEQASLQAEETCRITEEAVSQDKLAKCNTSSSMSAFQDSSPGPDLSFSCDFGSNTCEGALSSLKHKFDSWFGSLSTKVEQEKQKYIDATEVCDAATSLYQNTVSECNGKQTAFSDKKVSCESKQVTRTVAMCGLGFLLPAKCKAKQDYDNIIDWIDGNGTVYSDSERRSEWKSVSTIVCMLDKFKAKGHFTKGDMLSCEASSDYDADVGTLNKKDEVYQHLIAPENFTCSESSITFNGSLWAVPDGENTTSSQYTFASHSFAANMSHSSQAFGFCNESDATA